MIRKEDTMVIDYSQQYKFVSADKHETAIGSYRLP